MDQKEKPSLFHFSYVHTHSFRISGNQYLSLKLFEWTGQRWIITFTKKLGEISIKEKKHKEMIEVLKAGENSELFKRVLEKFPDANLINVTFKEKEKDN